MRSYYERYHELISWGYIPSNIWAELTSLGPEIRQEPLFSDAKAVARETMTRARHNLERLVKRLNDLDFIFLDPQDIWQPPDAQTPSLLDAFEAQYGPIPLSLRTWYEVVGPVSFMGSHPRLSFYDSFVSTSSNPIYSDPLVIDPLRNPPPSFYADLIFNDTGEDTSDPPYTIWLAPDAIHKANQSGGGPTQIMVPNPAMDAPLISDDWDGVLFVNYLRTCFQWGGFPGLRLLPDPPMEEIDFLTRGLLPF